MKGGFSKIFLISILWFIIIIIKIFFPDSVGNPHNNGYFIACCAVISFFLYPNSIIAIITILAFCLLCFISNDLIHPIGDASKIMMCLCSLTIAIKSNFSNDERKILFFIISTFILFDFIGMCIPSMYDTEDSDRLRYLGILHGANVTATIFGLTQIIVYELKYNTDSKRVYLYINLVLFLLMFMASRTRSLVFFLPYWGLQIYSNLNKKYFYSGCLIFFLFVIKDISNILTTFRFDELENDGSYLTRMFLYESMMNGIIDNLLIIPHGSNSANLLSKIITSDDDFAAHNDILLYWYDWGIIFLLLLIYGSKQLRKNINMGWRYVFIILAWSSACLHNVLLLPTVFFLFLIATNLYIYNITFFLKKSNDLNLGG